jgi:hypothetical protein
MCDHCRGISRRGFLEVVSAGAAVLGTSGWTTLQAAQPPAAKSKVRVGKIYLGIPHPGWPTPELDLAAEVQRTEEELKKLGPSLADVEFVDAGLVSNGEQLAAAKEKSKDLDGILVIHLSAGVGGMLDSLLGLGLPLVMFATPYSGHEWHTIASLQKLGKRIEMIPSSNYADLAAAIRPLRAIRRLKEAKVLYLRDGGADPEYVQAIQEKFGTEIRSLPYQDLLQAYQSIDEAQATAAAEQWTKGAQKVVEPSKEDIFKGARMGLALEKIVQQHQAAAITINCLGMGLIDKGLGYPCLGFCRLNDLGLGGVCEADLKSTMTHLIFLNLVGKPGFVTDPVIDLSNNTIIHAHCVSATKMDGPEGPSAPYAIRSHLEDGKGCVLQVTMRVGQKISMARLIGNEILLFSTGEIVDTPDVNRGCRTKITVKVADAQKFLDNWSCGLHRVVFYGDHTTDIRRYCRLMGIRLLMEGQDDLRNEPGLEWEPHVHA